MTVIFNLIIYSLYPWAALYISGRQDGVGYMYARINVLWLGKCAVVILCGLSGLSEVGADAGNECLPSKYTINADVKGEVWNSTESWCGDSHHTIRNGDDNWLWMWINTKLECQHTTVTPVETCACTARSMSGWTSNTGHCNCIMADNAQATTCFTKTTKCSGYACKAGQYLAGCGCTKVDGDNNEF